MWPQRGPWIVRVLAGDGSILWERGIGARVHVGESFDPRRSLELEPVEIVPVRRVTDVDEGFAVWRGLGLKSAGADVGDLPQRVGGPIEGEDIGNAKCPIG